jgi:two-component system sensor histidine kinase CreC
MKISLRILLGYFLLVAIAAWFVMNIFVDEVKPGVRQTTEDALVDTAHVLAQIANQDIQVNKIQNGALAQAFKQIQKDDVSANISGIQKSTIALRVYATNAQGIVIYDSTGVDVGADYARWNDVYLTLRGQYGVRSTRANPDDGTTSVMFVAAPIVQDGRIIGSLTVAKPNSTLMPVITRSENRILWAGGVLLGIALLIGGLIAWWVSRSIKTLQNYTVQVANGQDVALPHFKSPELEQLAKSVEHMRQQLEGKAYVEQYVHSLTHELKSPLTAIRSSAELLQENPPDEVRERFTQNIHAQTTRLQLLIERLLQLASIERAPNFATQSVALAEIIVNATQDVHAVSAQRHISIHTQLTAQPTVQVDKLMLTQAIVNVLDNAIDFSADGARIDIYDEASLRAYHLIIRDHGVGIPEYALDKIFERFYSLARPHTHKSTGLGLSFVREVMRKHGGDVEIANHPQGGVMVRLVLPK